MTTEDLYMLSEKEVRDLERRAAQVAPLAKALGNCDMFLRSLAVVEHPIVGADKVIELLNEIQTTLRAAAEEATA